MCVDLKEANILNDGRIDPKKHSEQRYISLICTVHRSRHSVNFEKILFINWLQIEKKIALGPKSEVLSCNPTKFGEKNELIYRIRIFFILEQSVDTPNNYIWRI